MKLYVVRHGLRANADPPPTGIDGDPRLTADGVEQAKEVAQYLRDKGITAIYSSAFYRCIETATPTSEALHVPIYVERGISEHYVPMRPTKPIPWPAEKSRAKFFKDIDPSYVSQVPVSADGETRDQLRVRVRKAMQKITRHAADEGHETIVVFTHAAIKITIAEVLVHNTVRAGTCSVDLYESLDLENWSLVFGGLTDFLSGGEQMNWNFEMLVEAGSAADEASRSADHTGEPRVLADGSVLPGAAPQDSAASQDSAAPQDSAAKKKFLISLDTSQLAEQDQPASFDPSEMHFAQMDSDRPIVQIGDRIYEGEWQRMVGTEVYTSRDGEPVGTSRDRIRLLRADVVQPMADQRSLMDRLRASE